MREWTKPATTVLLGFSLAVFCLCVYLSHLPVNYTYDGMVFASHVERDHQPLWDLFHPHHLLYTFLGRLWFLWGRAQGATWDGLVALQSFDLFTGILGVLLVFHLLIRETHDRLVAFFSASGLAFTFSYFYFSTTPGVRIFATVTPLFAWYVLTYLRNLPPAFAWVVGAAHGLAVLGHQTNLLLIPAFLGGIACLSHKTLWERFRSGIYYLVSLTLVVLAAYGFVGRFICYRKTYASWVWWVFSYFHVQQWGGHLQSAGFDRGKLAMVQAFLGKAMPYKTMLEPLTFGSSKTLFQFTLVALLLFLLFRLRHHWKRNRQILWVSVLWLLAFVPFFIWWEPWNIEFWVSSTVPCWVLMGLVVSDFSKQWVNPILRFAQRGAVVTAWAGLMTLLFFYNFHGTIAQASVNAYGHKALLGALDWKVKVDDLLILDGINTIPFYIDRYQKRRYLSLHAFLKKYKDEEKKNAAAQAGKGELTASLPKSDPWADLSGLFKTEWKKHRKVWVLAESVDDADGWRQRLEGLMKLTDGQIKTFFLQYQLKPVTYRGTVYFYEVLPPTEDQPTPPGKSGSDPKVSKDGDS